MFTALLQFDKQAPEALVAICEYRTNGEVHPTGWRASLPTEVIPGVTFPTALHEVGDVRVARL